MFDTSRADTGVCPYTPPCRGNPLWLPRGRFFLARVEWRAGRPRSQCRARWERERLARTERQECPARQRRMQARPQKTYPFRL